MTYRYKERRFECEKFEFKDEPINYIRTFGARALIKGLSTNDVTQFKIKFETHLMLLSLKNIDIYEFDVIYGGRLR
jgi:hypothetical protein